MRCSHTYADGKIVKDSPHKHTDVKGEKRDFNIHHEKSFSADGAPAAEPSAQTIPSYGDGGCVHPTSEVQNHADGGSVYGEWQDAGGGRRYRSAVAPEHEDAASPPVSAPRNPVASGNKSEPYEGVGGAARSRAIDKAVEEAGG